MSFLPHPLPFVGGFRSPAGRLQKRCGPEVHGGDVVSDFRVVLLELVVLGGVRWSKQSVPSLGEFIGGRYLSRYSWRQSWHAVCDRR